MGPDRAADPAGQAGRQQADRGRASGRRWAHVYPQHGLPVGAAAERPAAAQHRQRLLQALGLRWHAGADAPRALREMPEMADRQASPTAAIIDSQSVKSAEKGGTRLTRRALMQARRSK